jgi:hypothetical protein
MTEPYCLVCLKGFTRKEAEALALFSERMHAISVAERRQVCLYTDGGPVMVSVVREVLPKYSDRRAVKFMTRAITMLSQASALASLPPAGHA